MPLTLQTQYGQVVVAKLRQKLVTRNLFNSNYQINAVSGAIMIPITPEDTLGDYNKASITSNAVGYDANAWIPCTIDKDKFLNKYLDGYNVASLPYNVLADNLERAGYALAKAMDDQGITVIKNAVQGLDKSGNAFTSADPRYDSGSTYGIIESVGSTDVYEVVADLAGKMTDRGVPEDGRYLIVSGTFKAKILASNKAIRQGDLAQEKIDKGVIAEIAGFDVYSTGQINGTIGSGSSAKALYALAGHPDFATRVESFAVEPTVVDAAGSGIAVGGVFVQGRYVFTHEVANPKAFGMITA